MVAWIEVLIAMVEAPSVPIQGTIRRTGPVESSISFVGDVPPVFVSGVDDLRVWRDGRRVRVDTADGRPVARTDGDRAWRWAFDDDLPIEAAVDELGYVGPGSELLTTRPPSRWIGDDFTHPVGAIDEIDFLGRPCWSFDLAPPAHKPHPMQMVVDTQTGMVLEERNDAFGVAVGFVEFTAGIPIDPDIFVWTGDVSAPAHHVPSSRSTPSLDERRGDELRWFRENVTDTELSARVPVILTVKGLQDHDDTGRFEAWVGNGPVEGRLARRPRSHQPWDEFWMAEAQVWSTAKHDWAIRLYGITLDDAALADLRRQLHPGDDVVGQPPVER